MLPEMTRVADPRIKQVVWAVAFFVVLSSSVVTALVMWRKIPGLLGEWIGLMVGIMSTPFFLEATFVCLGIITVVSLNSWRRHKDGDEFVYLEEVTGDDVPKNLPDSARWVVYTDKPLENIVPSRLEQAEGAFEIGDYAVVSQILAEMTAAELAEKSVLKLRIRLAEATGHPELAARLTGEL